MPWSKFTLDRVASAPTGLCAAILTIDIALDIALHFAPLLCLTKASSQQLFQEISQPKALLQLDFLGPTGRTRGPTGRTACKLSLANNGNAIFFTVVVP